MFKKIQKQKGGFTLVEMLIAMAIFVTFTGILINSYSSVVKAQREANDYRIMYVEARQVFEALTQELRDGMVDYGHYDGTELPPGVLDEIYLVSKDNKVKTYIDYDDNTTVKVLKSVRDPVTGIYPVPDDPKKLNSDEVKVKSFKIYVSPLIDPYDQDYVDYDINQFHPKVTVYAEFERTLRSGKVYTMDLRTTISSRIYNQVYEN